MAERQDAPAAPRPVLVVMVGLPGSGKSSFARLLAAALDAAHVQSDVLRRQAFPEPRYTTAEHQAVFQLVHQHIQELLRQGRVVVFDATNLYEHKRQDAYRLAEAAGAGVVVVHTYAPEQVVAQRMAVRSAGADAEDASEAGWDIYLQMRRRVDPILRPHFVVNTVVAWGPGLEKVAAAVRRAAL